MTRAQLETHRCLLNLRAYNCRKAALSVQCRAAASTVADLRRWAWHFYRSALEAARENRKAD